MTTNYDQDQVAGRYKEAKEHPWRLRVETYSLMKRVGDVRGRKVIDIACGEGHFTRRIRRAGAASVVGIDISERMIELARSQEASAPLGIEYRVEDARALVPQQDFDLAVSAWLLVYARDRAELAGMCQALARRVRPGGRFVTITTNPDVYFFDPAPDYRRYGFEMKLAGQVYEGAPIRFLHHLDESVLEIENYYLPLSAYQSAFEEAGFGDFKVHALELAPDSQAGDDRRYWADFLDYPVAILMECVKE